MSEASAETHLKKLFKLQTLLSDALFFQMETREAIVYVSRK